MTHEIPKQSPAPLKVGMLMYPGFTLLDLAGPQAVLGMHAETYLIWKTLDPVPTDSGMSLNPTHTFDQVPDDLDVLFVPGGFTTNDQMADDEILDFLIEAGKTARYVTSVCSGALILGQAGLLDGYRAATHWAVYPVLEAMGVVTSPDRVVIDRSRMTGGGVTAGIDFGLTLLAELRGEDVAKITQLMIEYNPKPPFNTGHPDTAGPEMVAMVHNSMGDGPLKAGIEIAKSKRGEPVPT
ncbi:DJ-1/PfpI family protein [Jannaschia pohangensis]|uniref:Transcriptional regulator GlxA family, contains an amidase domain and an AraC-type DNA-binding HTH domain n=1 Tax=Jannaschia pohangensis TaxID=390807 RepID=A0A1I3UUD1_9RHOB|nr:DJ-1/PfpI family protein [Jannaschia pohangensis]SFJ86605.1 Transcriptional regulator GlxA family, contains an amidase domain and an AraC-type DNA-binding HTH domain [Jannaschia pohangensis]